MNGESIGFVREAAILTCVVLAICLLSQSSTLADAPPPPCEDPCSAGCPMYGQPCCELPGANCCPTGAQGEVDCNNNILDPCELANCIGADCSAGVAGLGITQRMGTS